ncbi:unnamed protein product [Schistosoma margrebowiei]|uniref:Uncharacterized protein n=1 Tax=Schistosoma margrebowiei TaxID=48269 RepID=A0A3P7XHW7_9TREM|nr:unnamed protein product [Schistosoma margrebowiei]
MFPQDTGAHVDHRFGVRLKRRTFAFRHEKAVSRTSLAEAVYAWPCESISRWRANTPRSRPYQSIWGQFRSNS